MIATTRKGIRPLVPHSWRLNWAGTTERVDCWPMPEVRNNIDMTTGMLGLTDQEENQIVAFLMTLTDGFTRT